MKGNTNLQRLQLLHCSHTVLRRLLRPPKFSTVAEVSTRLFAAGDNEFAEKNVCEKRQSESRGEKSIRMQHGISLCDISTAKQESKDCMKDNSLYTRDNVKRNLSEYLLHHSEVLHVLVCLKGCFASEQLQEDAAHAPEVTWKRPTHPCSKQAE